MTPISSLLAAIRGREFLSNRALCVYVHDLKE